MKHKLQLPKLPTRREKLRRGVLRKLHANLFKKRASTTADPTVLDGDVPNMGVGRALLVIVLLHVLAVAGYCVHKIYFEKKGTDTIVASGVTNVTNKRNDDVSKNANSIPSLSALPPQNNEGLGVPVRAGDNYATIALENHVTEQELRDYNGNAALFAGLVLRIPPHTIQTLESPELRALRNANNPAKAMLVKPNIIHEEAPRATLVSDDLQETVQARSLTTSNDSQKNSYNVRRGDTYFSIAKKHGVTVKALMSVNKIKNDKSLSAGQTLKIPH